MKTKEKLNALKEEVETVSRKLSALTDEELAQVSGGENLKIVYTNENGEQEVRVSQLSPRGVEVN